MTVGELIKNHKLALLGTLGTGAALVFAALALIIFIRTGCGENLDRSGEQFARHAIETITSWDHEAVLELMPSFQDRPDFISSVKNSCAVHRIQLGPRTGPVQVEGDAVGRFMMSQKAFATATYSSRCTFKNGKATLSIQLYKNVKIAGTNGPWLLLGFHFSDLEN
jgi:hypothetical protein